MQHTIPFSSCFHRYCWWFSISHFFLDNLFFSLVSFKLFTLSWVFYSFIMICLHMVSIYLFVCLFILLRRTEFPELEDSTVSPIPSHYSIPYYLYFIHSLLSFWSLPEMYVRIFHSMLCLLTFLSHFLFVFLSAAF